MTQAHEGQTTIYEKILKWEDIFPHFLTCWIFFATSKAILCMLNTRICIANFFLHGYNTVGVSHLAPSTMQNHHLWVSIIFWLPFQSRPTKDSNISINGLWNPKILNWSNRTNLWRIQRGPALPCLETFKSC